ncbi:hypothetical protein Cgig2_002792 [Carnegiea gigantea]|uniref:Uncharacterized protein n=1 Tax=Carnegiea gigantea TaxID=171969 RepID=A0A9Q1KN13_9CARY|nr:hypothetical protein Cgig2_002792 [Carnegiea gigantea]
MLDAGEALPHPKALLINGQTESTFTGDQVLLGILYFRKNIQVQSVKCGLSTTFNFRIQGHKLKVVEVEGSNILQTVYDSVDVHVGQSLSILVTLDQAPQDYYIVASTRFAKPILNAIAVLHYSNSTTQVELKIKCRKAKSSRIIPLRNHPDFEDLCIVFQNDEKTLQSLHLDGYDFWFWFWYMDTGQKEGLQPYRCSHQAHHSGVSKLMDSHITVLGQPRDVEPQVFNVGKAVPWTATLPEGGNLINGQFPGPTVNAEADDNVIVNIHNKLDEPFLMTWLVPSSTTYSHGIQQRNTSWQDAVLGTTCPLPPNTNWTYKMQMKDQIGSFSFYPSTLMHIAAGGYGALNVHNRSKVSVPYPKPDKEFTLFIAEWFNIGYKRKSNSGTSILGVSILTANFFAMSTLQKNLDAGNKMPLTDGLIINGHPSKTTIVSEAGKTYMIRVWNVGIMTSINIRIQEHSMKLVEVGGSHVLQNTYDSLDIHPGQSLAFLVTFNGTAKDYYFVASSRFTRQILLAAAVLHYAGSNTPVSGPLPDGPTYQIHWSMQQARSIR